jgi:asparagine synthase (glutamine-hydrolysing)
MCGILGGNAFTTKKQVQKSLKTIEHRGKDNATVIEPFKGLYMAHNRLSIQDLSDSANQPFEDVEEELVIVFNGELWKKTIETYSYLRDKYKTKTQNSDTELLALLYKEFGQEPIDFMKRLDGMFSFCIYDKKRDILFLGRDFIGRLPFYYISGIKDNKIAFSSEIKALNDTFEVNYYHANKNSKDKKKEAIKTVQPGTCMIYHLSDGQIFTHRYFDFNDYLKIKLDEEDLGVDVYSKKLYELLDSAVNNELISDVPLCTILSGGIDSVIITYLLSKKVKNLKAFVVNVSSGKRKANLKDDLYYARAFAKEIGIELIEVDVTKDDIVNRLSDSIYASEDWKWTQISPAVAQLFLAEEINKRGYKVVFGGEGSDEIFASYGDVFRWSWQDPIEYHKKRVTLLRELHRSNLIRTNKAMMFGGTVELRTPFLDKEVVNFGLRLPTRYRDEANGKGKVMKYMLRKSFEGKISDEILWRPKKTFQVGCHTDFLKKDKELIKKYFDEHFIKYDDAITIENWKTDV